jgi:Skp family chaperone for outer membrane proteins
MRCERRTFLIGTIYWRSNPANLRVGASKGRRFAMKCRTLGPLMLACALLPLPARAQTGPVASNAGLRVGYFSAERAFAESADGKKAIARLTALRDEKARGVDARNKELAAREQILRGDAASLTASALTQQTAAVEKFRLDIQRFIQDAQAEVMGVQRDLEGAFLVKLKPALDKVVTTKGLQLVLRVDTPLVVWFDPADDITADVGKQLAAETPPKN